MSVCVSVVSQIHDRCIDWWMSLNDLQVFVAENLLWPNGLTIDYSNKMLYWCDVHLSHIERIHLDGTNRQVNY